jgi:cell division septation protein DedD
LAPHTQDDAFHEIQLNGKQLVFLFMAATVVSVVIFLCGVLVGRGVRAERAIGVSEVALGTVVTAETMPPRAPTTPVPAPPGSDPTAAVAPPPAVDDLSYYNRLEKPNQTTDELKSVPTTDHAAARAPAKASGSETRAAAPPAENEPARSTSDEKAAAEPTAQGYVVQVAALNIRTEADAIAKRLSSKGYSAYVIPPPTGTPAVYRVRVGRFGTRREAESVAAKLQREEQFKPWITR